MGSLWARQNLRGYRMKTFKIIIITLFLVPLTTSFASKTGKQDQWINFFGCYRTVELNGHSLDYQGELNYTTIQNGDAWFVKDLYGRKIPSYKLKLYKGHDDLGNGRIQHHFTIATAFHNLGETTEVGSSVYFNFEGPLLYAFDTSLQITLTHKIEVHRIDSKRIRVYSLVIIPEANGELDSDDHFVLEEINCY